MALTSSSTLTDALNQYKDNLLLDGDITKAQNALEAIRYILASRPRIVATNNRNINFESLQQEQTKLESFVSRFSSAANRCSFTRARMLTI